MPTKSRHNGTDPKRLVTTSLRIEADVLERFREAAESEERTMNAQLRVLITTYLEARASGDRRAA